MFTLITSIIAIILSVIDNSLNLYAVESVGILSAIYSLFICLPSIAVTARRLHDTNRTVGGF